MEVIEKGVKIGGEGERKADRMQLEHNRNETRQRRGRLGQTAALGKGRNGIKEHSRIKKAQMRKERRRRSDKRKASTKEANKENPKGGINHCPTYPPPSLFILY